MKISPFNRITITAVAVMMTTILFSCQKEGSLSETNSTDNLTEEEAATYSDESVQAEASFDDVEDISMSAAEDESDATLHGRVAESARRTPTFVDLRLRLGNCATITVSPNDSTYPKTITIDFGPNGCWCADGKYRRGAIIIHLTGPIRRSGSVMTITLRDFYLNRAHIEGTKTLSNLSENGNIKFTVQVTGGKVTFPNGRGYKYQVLKYVKQIEGGDTRRINDDVYSVEGRSKTEFNNGVFVTFNSESPLIKKNACPWISNGTLKINANGWIMLVDYGAPNNGDCDNKALLTWNNGNNQRLITLP
jgi:hypothetical protein